MDEIGFSELDRTSAALEAANVGVWDWNIATGELVWDDTIARLHGIDPAAFDGTMEMFFARVHPDDQAALQTAIAAALEHAGRFLTEFRVVGADATRWIQGRGAVVTDDAGAPVRMLGIGLDTTELRSAHERAGRSIELASDGLALIDADWRIAYVNPEAMRVLGATAHDLVGRDVREVFPDAVGTVAWSEFRAALHDQQQTEFEVFYPPLGAWFELRVLPAPDGLTVFFRNIDARRAADAERAELVDDLTAALARGERLQQITVELADALNVSQVAAIVQRQARAALDTYFAVVGLVDTASGTVRFQPSDAIPEDFAEVWNDIPLTRRVPVTEVTRRGMAAFYETRAELLEEYPDLAEVVALVGNAAFATMPLVAGGRVMGVLSVSWPTERQISRADRDFLATIAAQCAQAIERAELFEHERTVARTLQRAILPELLPAFASLQFVGRYLPAEVGIDVGGDWYDAFPLSDGTVALVVGDVTGHGLDAAATMAQLRNMLRAYAFGGAGPAEAMRRLDEVLVTTGSDQYATCLYATFDPTSRRITWSNAGHHAPVIVDPDGTARAMVMRHDPLLGFGGEHSEIHGFLEPGTRLVMFTDGLIERRSSTIDEGLERLVGALDGRTPEDLEEMGDQIIRATSADVLREDDLCLLLVALEV